MIAIDGSAGEGGGQVLRTSLALAALTGRSCQLYNVRAGRSRPGLRPQHLAAVHAVAAVCGATLRGAALGSRELTFTPTHPPQGGSYVFDVADYAPRKSGGAIGLIFQALLWPLLGAGVESQVTLHGGTHVPFSPPFHYLQHVFLPAAARLGVAASLQLEAWGWMFEGQGRLTANIQPAGGLRGATFAAPQVTRVAGVAAVTNLPAHIPQRMASRAYNLLSERGIAAADRHRPGARRGPGRRHRPLGASGRRLQPGPARTAGGNGGRAGGCRIVDFCGQ